MSIISIFSKIMSSIANRLDPLLITVVRRYFADTYTIGTLYVEGKRYCDTLEDTDRGLTSDMPLDTIKAVKVYGQTAIPYGTYKVSVQYWAKHKINVPYLHDVPGFSGILIHNGGSDADTIGCILVGKNTAKGRLSGGSPYMHGLTNLVSDAVRAGRPVRIVIKKK